MRVAKYVPRDMYGFCEDDEGNRVFFHLSRFADFVTDYPTPPIVGEPVEVFVPVDLDFNAEDRAPRAERVVRMEAPKRLSGKVTRFSPDRGYGFVLGEDQVSYYLHRVEVGDSRIPSRNTRVTFVPGMSRGKHRACQVQFEE